MILLLTRITLGSCILLLTTGTFVAGVTKAVRKQRILGAAETNAVRKQDINSRTTNLPPPRTCNDDRSKAAICAQADMPCHCEENRYEMYTYCKRSCGYCAQEKTPQRFWRVVNWAPLNRTWYINEIQFFQSKHDKNPLATNDPTKAIASSTYLSFPASNAFDANINTAWLPDGWWERQAGGDWIGYDFPQPVDINSVRVVSDFNDSSDVAASMLIEAGPTPFGPFETRWMITNKQRIADKRFNNPKCPLFWKRFMSDEDAFCYKLITEYLTWSDARDKCAKFGGDLVSINSHEEQVFVQHELLACGFTWIGFNDIQKEKQFTWSDGSESKFFYWASDEEKDDRMNEMEDCAAMGKDGQWRQFHCEDKFYAFCKKRILTDNDKVVQPNTGSTPSQPVNQSLPAGVPPVPTILPPGIDLPPGVTPPPPPPYPYPYPTIPPRYPAPTPAPPVTTPSQQGTTPAGVTPTPAPAPGTPTPAPGTPEPSTPAPGTPAPGTPAPGTPAPGTPAPGTPAPGTPAPAPGTPAPGAPPAAVPPPAPAAVPPPAPAAVPPPAPAAAPPPPPAAGDQPTVDDNTSNEEDAEEIKPKHKNKMIHSSKAQHLKENKKGKKHHKKAERKQKYFEKQQDTDRDFMEELEPANEQSFMNDFLGMVARSNIPKPDISEKELRSNIRRQELVDAERKLEEEKRKDENVQAASTERRR